jgi:outer membrane protein assembly factor BamD
MRTRILLILMLGVVVGGCGRGNPNLPAPGSVEADKYLFEHGADALKREHWTEARLYFQKLTDTYPQSPYRQDAKLGIGDTYLGEDSIESNILGVNEFREFLSFFPGNPKTDYAQYRIATGYSQQMLGPERDSTPAQDALAACETFLRLYPNSEYKDEVLAVQRNALDEISGKDFRIGVYYYRYHWYPGAIERFKTLLEKDPAFSQRDAVYFYLGEIYHASKQDAEALPYYDRIIKEFEKSDFLERAQKRVAELATTPQPEGSVKR